MTDEQEFTHENGITRLAKEIYGDLNVEFFVLSEDAQERETQISSLRVEIMAGGGPDGCWLRAVSAAEGAAAKKGQRSALPPAPSSLVQYCPCAGGIESIGHVPQRLRLRNTPRTGSSSDLRREALQHHSI